ncbi:hypothetical protein U6G28_06605 [Actinomycetaceae bacterium MB13-C1-2]|nr:hypothetical protein U6G28_06605 [Actinomycetaceae bacterium MB13-C1-2]
MRDTGHALSVVATVHPNLLGVTGTEFDSFGSVPITGFTPLPTHSLTCGTVPDFRVLAGAS